MKAIFRIKWWELVVWWKRNNPFNPPVGWTWRRCN